MNNSASEKRFFVPEVIQTSAMDCGPASLKALLEGYGISVSYGRLREACQTSVDGTSIDTIEDIANQLGLEAEQIMVPADHLLIPVAQTIPAIVVVKLPNGMTHFVVVWSRHGSFFQVMDPGIGRRWVSKDKFLSDVYIHTHPVEAERWREWAGSDGFIIPLTQRFRLLNIEDGDLQRLLLEADSDKEWHSFAALDASLRLVDSLTRARGIQRGKEALGVINRFFHHGVEQAHYLDELSKNVNINVLGDDVYKSPRMQIPAAYWSVIPYQKSAGDEEDHQESYLLMRGAVLVRVLGLRTTDKERVISFDEEEGNVEKNELPPELEAALKEKPIHPLQKIFSMMKEDGWFTPMMLIVAVALAAFGTIIEAILFQGILQIGGLFSMIGQRTVAIGLFFALFIIMTIMELPIAATTMQLGRKIESRLRVAFLEKIPKLSDRYFHSRLISDMTQRAHELRLLSSMPNLGVSFLRTAFHLVFTTIGIIWLDPISAPLAVGATIFFMGLSLITKQFLEEGDLRVRTHLGALDHFYLDSLIGLIPARTHGAERSLRREHEFLLSEWARASLESLRLGKALQGISALSYSIFAIWIVFNYIAKGGQSSGILLLFYWTLSLPAMGQALVMMTQQYPSIRSTMLRILEPIQTPDETEGETFEESQEDFDAWLGLNDASERKAVSIEMKDVKVIAGGHVILSEINLHIEPNEHIGIVGLSGSGKSSLIGLLLGWHKPASGKVLVNGKELTGRRLIALRKATAWVDPAVQLWNKSLLDNLQFGMKREEGLDVREVIEEADLYDLLSRLPDGLQTILGEGGGLVSGGEGQRVRLARAMLRRGTKLVLLDEPFRGLDRQKRRELLLKAREHWKDTTLLFVTHDVSETINFHRVLVIDNGKILEDGNPMDLMNMPYTKFSALIKAEEEVREGLWRGEYWRRLWLENGNLTETSMVSQK